MGKLIDAAPWRRSWHDALEPHALELVKGVYRQVLGREADPAGLEHWLAYLRRGGSFDGLLRGFARSPEFARRAAAPPPAPARALGPPGLPDPARPPSDDNMPPLAVGGARSTPLRFALLGNCQMHMVARCLQALVGGPRPPVRTFDPNAVQELRTGAQDLTAVFEGHDRIVTQPWLWLVLRQRYARYESKVLLVPYVAFMAFHPDLVPLAIRATGAAFEYGPLLRCHSSIAYLGWRAGLSVEQTVALFNGDVFRQLGFFDHWRTSYEALLEEGRQAGLPLDDLLVRWTTRGCFMYCHVHPKLHVFEDLTRAMLSRAGIPAFAGDPVAHVHDLLGSGVHWPVYPEIADALGIAGDYTFKMYVPHFRPDQPVDVLDLREFVQRSFEGYGLHAAEHGPDALRLDRLELGATGYRELYESLRARGAPPAAAAVPAAPAPAHPYRDLPDERFWRRAVSGRLAERVDPVGRPRLTLDPGTRIATAGSCFAQHIAARLKQRGFTVMQTERPPEGLPPAEATRRQYGVYCARYGNVYTARHLLQLVQRAYGEFEPADAAWARGERWVDPFRPQVEPDGFDSAAAVAAARREHLAAVREMLETLDVFVFTLGLTEGWRAKADGAVFPLAPGVAGGAMDPQRYEFVNFTAAEVEADLSAFAERLARLNPAARILFTVSPVPLAATYSDRHVVAATTYSKSVLRVAAEQLVRRNERCEYFPSYEIVAGHHNRGCYYAPDGRAVTSAGVDQVMRLFFRHYAPQAPEPVDRERVSEVRRYYGGVVCEEELLSGAAS